MIGAGLSLLTGGLSRPVMYGLAALGLAAAVAVGAWGVLAHFEARERAAVRAAVAERDAHWTAQIAASNAVAEAARLASVQAALDAESRAAEQAAALRANLATLEALNAQAPRADDCGLDPDRVRGLDAIGAPRRPDGPR